MTTMSKLVEFREISPIMTYLHGNLSTFVEIWGTIVWLFAAAHFLIHAIVAWYAWRVVRNDKAPIPWFSPVLACVAAAITGFVIIAILGMLLLRMSHWTVPFLGTNCSFLLIPSTLPVSDVPSFSSLASRRDICNYPP